jgi:hypothetical protein
MGPKSPHSPVERLQCIRCPAYRPSVLWLGWESFQDGFRCDKPTLLESAYPHTLSDESALRSAYGWDFDSKVPKQGARFCFINAAHPVLARMLFGHSEESTATIVLRRSATGRDGCCADGGEADAVLFQEILEFFQAPDRQGSGHVLGWRSEPLQKISAKNFAGSTLEEGGLSCSG